MPKITFEGDKERCAEFIRIAYESETDPQIEKEVGYNGADLVQLTVEHGADVLKLLTALTGFIKVLIETHHAYKIAFKSDDDDKHRK